MSYADTPAALNEQGWRQKSRRVSEPHPFNLDAVEGCLKTWRVYAGELAIGIRQERRYVPGAHAPILPVELCQRVENVLKKRCQSKSRPTATATTSSCYRDEPFAPTAVSTWMAIRSPG